MIRYHDAEKFECIRVTFLAYNSCRFLVLISRIATVVTSGGGTCRNRVLCDTIFEI